MQNFSQINKSTNRKKQKGIQDAIQFKIQPPSNERRSSQLIQQSSILDHPQKSNSQVLKNTARSSQSNKLEQQYISFKIKPSGKSQNLWKENKNYRINFTKQSNTEFQNQFLQNELLIVESEKNSLSKSPEFLCKKASPTNASNDCFEESYEQKFNLKNIQNSNQEGFKLKDKKKFFNDKNPRDEDFDNFIQVKQKRLSLEKDQFNFLLSQDFEGYEVRTPYIQLKEQFQRQQRFLGDQKAQVAYQFDSFNQSHNKDNFIQFDLKNKLSLDNFESFEKKIINHQKDKSLRKKISNQIENRDINKQFFFLTDPTLEESNKHKQNESKSKEFIRTPKQKQVRQFCFNISQIKFQDEKEQLSYCNPNLFSNSNEYLMFFDSKNVQKSESSQNSKRMQVRQMVQEFIQQLQHVDDKSLNQKVVSNLQNVLEEIVFKQPKKKIDPITIEDHNFTPKQQIQNQTKNLYDDSKFKKWTKPKRNLNSISCQRKIFDELNYQNYDKYNKIKKFKLQVTPPNSIIPSKFSYEKVREKNTLLEKSEIEKKEEQNNKPEIQIYKPNFDFNIHKGSLNNYYNRKNQQLTPPKNLMFTKHKQSDSSQIKINPKGSIYFNNSKRSNSRQHLKTQTSRKTWRVY